MIAAVARIASIRGTLERMPMEIAVRLRISGDGRAFRLPSGTRSLLYGPDGSSALHGAVTDLEDSDDLQPGFSGTATLRFWGDDLVDLTGVNRLAIWYGEPIGEAIVERIVARP